jgi:hypothetical protein
VVNLALWVLVSSRIDKVLFMPVLMHDIACKEVQLRGTHTDGIN